MAGRPAGEREACGCSWHPRQSARWAHCRVCGGTPDVVGRISTRGKCQACGEARLRRSLIDLHGRQGPTMARQVAGYLRYLEKVTGDSEIGAIADRYAAPREPGKIGRPPERNVRQLHAR